MLKKRLWNRTKIIRRYLLRALFMFALSIPVPCCGNNLGAVPLCGGYHGPPPCLSASQFSLDFGAVERGSSKTLQELIYNHCAQSLNWTASSNRDWISINKPHGTIAPGKQASAQVTINTKQLTPGTYTATLEISDLSETDYISIKLTVP
jgi:hypothetical protein